MTDLHLDAADALPQRGLAEHRDKLGGVLSGDEVPPPDPHGDPQFDLVRVEAGACAFHDRANVVAVLQHAGDQQRRMVHDADGAVLKSPQRGPLGLPLGQAHRQPLRFVGAVDGCPNIGSPTLVETQGVEDLFQGLVVWPSGASFVPVPRALLEPHQFGEGMLAEPRLLPQVDEGHSERLRLRGPRDARHGITISHGYRGDEVAQWEYCATVMPRYSMYLSSSGISVVESRHRRRGQRWRNAFGGPAPCSLPPCADSGYRKPGRRTSSPVCS